jgi:hypothetical protein
MKLQLFLLYSFMYRDHFAEGLRLFDLNRFEEAIFSFDMAIKHDPNNSLAKNNRKLLLEKLKSK